jgi:probable phosphoglycerate mutase
MTTATGQSWTTSGALPLRGTELIMARHGQGVCNAAGVIGGQRGCSGLSPLGRQQSLRIAAQLAGMHRLRPFEAVFCTPRPRVRQSAQLLAEALGLTAVEVTELRGQDFGTADGLRWAEVTAAFGGPPAHDPDRPIAPGAEPWNSYTRRVLAALSALLADNAGRRVLVVGHGKTIGLAGALLSGTDDPGPYVPEHGCLVHWRWTDPGWCLTPAATGA